MLDFDRQTVLEMAAAKSSTVYKMIVARRNGTRVSSSAEY